jgi:hypothetical protein
MNYEILVEIYAPFRVLGNDVAESSEKRVQDSTSLLGFSPFLGLNLAIRI